MPSLRGKGWVWAEALPRLILLVEADTDLSPCVLGSLLEKW